MRRYTMSSLLFSLAQKALLEERVGAAWEQVHCHLTGDGDYSGIAVIDEGKVPALADDDISAADRIRNGEQQAKDEAARLRQIEAFRQQEAERLAALRAAREANE